MKLLVRIGGDSHAPLTLICFPHAGGGATQYLAWKNHLSDLAELWVMCAPGREARVGELPYVDLNCLLNDIVDDLRQFVDRPLVLLGHSFGALLAHEIAWKCSLDPQLPRVRLIIVAAAVAPCRIPFQPRFAGLPRRQMIDQISKRYGGFSEAQLQDSTLLNMVAPALRADLALFEAYVSPKRPMMAGAVRIWAGEQDIHQQPDLWAWNHHYTNTSDIEYFPGGHFFLHSARDQVIEKVRYELASIDR